MAGSEELKCKDCGVKITGVPVVPRQSERPTQAQIQKLKPTVYLCAECAEERGLSFDQIALAETGEEAPPAAT
jgi:DNA-directed RNA polymerase subunit RPC12/RpoP